MIFTIPTQEISVRMMTDFYQREYEEKNFGKKMESFMTTLWVSMRFPFSGLTLEVEATRKTRISTKGKRKPREIKAKVMSWNHNYDFGEEFGLTPEQKEFWQGLLFRYED